jgi:hypothetical protein
MPFFVNPDTNGKALASSNCPYWAIIEPSLRELSPIRWQLTRVARQYF